MEQMEIINNMLCKAKEHNLEVECIVTLINDLVGLTDDELKKACDYALGEWDI